MPKMAMMSLQIACTSTAKCPALGGRPHSARRRPLADREYVKTIRADRRPGKYPFPKSHGIQTGGRIEVGKNAVAGAGSVKSSAGT